MLKLMEVLEKVAVFLVMMEMVQDLVTVAAVATTVVVKDITIQEQAADLHSYLAIKDV